MKSSRIQSNMKLYITIPLPITYLSVTNYSRSRSKLYREKCNFRQLFQYWNLSGHIYADIAECIKHSNLSFELFPNSMIMSHNNVSLVLSYSHNKLFIDRIINTCGRQTVRFTIKGKFAAYDLKFILQFLVFALSQYPITQKSADFISAIVQGVHNKSMYIDNYGVPRFVKKN